MLTIEGLTKTYANGVKALDGINLTVPKGLFGLLGPNGAGKSTLMRTLATLQEPDAGTITLNDLDLLREKDAIRRSLGYLPQEFGAYPRTSPLVMLDHIAVLKGITDKKTRSALVEQLLVQTNLWDVRDKHIDGFSGGMRQRFGIAQALIGNPQLIIVDEPTAGLDPAERRRFHNLLARIGEDVVVLLSTHIVEDVADLCPRMAIMAGGRILLEGEPRPHIEALRQRLWRLAVPREQVASVEGLPVISHRLVAGQTELRLMSETAPVADAEPAEPSLEDVYFATLKEHGLELDLEAA